jgi:dynein heavy chain 2, cytosolic
METEVGDQQSLVASLRLSTYFSMFQDQIEGWDKRLGILQDALNSMNSVQRKWLYLEPIFARGALPEQAQHFRHVLLSSRIAPELSHDKVGIRLEL